MAKISNTTVYPTVTPADDDLLILTDANDSNRTKTVKLSGLKSYMDVYTYTASVTVTADEIKDSFSMPVVLIPGVATKHIQPISVLVKYTFNTTGYTAPNDFVIGLGGVANPNLFSGIPSGYVDAEVADYAFSLPTNYTTSYGNTYTTAVGGDNLLFACETANPTLGDGTLTFDIMYRLVNA
jgi:hypothetical protein